MAKQLRSFIALGAVAFIAFMALMLPCPADTVTDPYTWVSGQTITAATQNTRFTALFNGFTTISNVNIKTAAAIDPAKLDLTKQFGPVLRSAAATCFSAGNTGDANNRWELTSDGIMKFGAGGATAIDMALTREDSTTLAVRNAANNAYRNLKVAGLTASGAGAFNSLTSTTAIPIASGGTNNGSLGVSALGIYAGDGSKVVQVTGTANQSFRVNGTGTAIEAYTPAATKFTPSAKSADFTANDSSGTFYLITASSAVAVTLPASPADGTIYLFDIVSGSSLVTFTANGVETIDLHTSSATTATMQGTATGVMALCAVSGGWKSI